MEMDKERRRNGQGEDGENDSISGLDEVLLVYLISLLVYFISLLAYLVSLLVYLISLLVYLTII